jgi:hypothetical protein
VNFRELFALTLAYRSVTDPAVRARVEELVPSLKEWVTEPLQQPVARHLIEWGETAGDVLWWRFPVEEPPYVGSPLCDDWPGYHTHWTPLPPVPREPS